MKSKLLASVKAQQTIPGLIFVFAMLLTLGALTPTIIQISSTTAGNLSASGNGAAATVVGLVPLFLWLMFVITIFVYAQPFRAG